MKRKFVTLILLLASITKKTMFGPANKQPIIPPKKIIAIVLTSNIGDMIFATSVFRAIKEKYPESHLTVVGSKKNAITLSGNKDIDNYLVNPSSVWKLIGHIRKLKPDFGFTLVTSSFDIAAMFLGKVRSIACFDVQNAEGAHTRSYKVFKNICIQVPYYIGRYVSLEYLRILEPLGVFSTNTSKYLFYPPDIRDVVMHKFRERGTNLDIDKVVAVSPGAGTKIKQWPVDRFAEVARYLEKQGFKVAVIGGPEDTGEISMLQSRCEDIIDASDLSLEELKFFISKCRLLIANDSGPVYIAEAFKVPTLVVVGPTDEMEHPPHGPLNIVVTPPRSVAPVMRGHLVGYDKEHARAQIEQVQVRDVVNSLDRLLDNVRKLS